MTFSEMRRLSLLAFVAWGLLSPAQAADDQAISLKAMGSFHVGGRLVEISGKPVKEMLFSAGGSRDQGEFALSDDG